MKYQRMKFIELIQNIDKLKINCSNEKNYVFHFTSIQFCFDDSIERYIMRGYPFGFGKCEELDNLKLLFANDTVVESLDEYISLCKNFIYKVRSRHYKKAKKQLSKIFKYIKTLKKINNRLSEDYDA